MTNFRTRFGALCLLGLLIAFASVAHADVVDAYLRADTPFPQFAYFWSDSSLGESQMFTDQQGRNGGQPLGGSIHVYLVNTGSRPVAVDDVLFQGVSLKRAIAFSKQRKFKRVAYAASVYFSDLSDAERGKLISAGEPIWCKMEPQSMQPGEAAEVIVRLRRMPKEPELLLTLKYSEGAPGEVPVVFKDDMPQFAGISFSPQLDRVYLYVRQPAMGKPVSKVLMDGQDMTADSTIAEDAGFEIQPVVLKLRSPIVRGSFHCFQAVYADGSKATAGIRAYADELTYAIWGGKSGKESEPEIGRAFIEEIAQHNINVQMESLGSGAVRAFVNSDAGKQLMKSLGISRIVGDPAKWATPWTYYLADEPDTADVKVQGVPQQSKIGCLGQGLIARADELRKGDPNTPNMLNVDMTFKPENWYIYGQLPDILAADPYYQTRLCQAYWDMPGRLPAYAKCTFVNAVASVCESACEPNPLHIILSCARRSQEDRKFRFGTREEKRIELYYALAAGAKGFSYWWYTPLHGGKGADGCGADEPGAAALWNEIGLLGAEVGTVGPLVTRSCPAAVLTTASRKLWVRSLLSGQDTMLVLCVNDDYANDRVGTVIKPVEKAEVTLDLPAWLDARNVFEVDAKGTHDVAWDASGSKLNCHLGTVNVTRMIIVTSDQRLRGEIQKRYDSRFAANVTKLMSPDH